MRAGAPDNVTVVVADIVDLDSGATPSTVPRSSGRQPTADRAPGPSPSPPQRRRQHSPARSPARPTTTTAEEAPARAGVAGCAASPWPLALIVLGGGAYAAYDWVQRQYYVGVEDGNVAIFRGVSQDLGPIRLSSVEERSSIQTADLPDFYRNRVENTVSTSTLGRARVGRQPAHRGGPLCVPQGGGRLLRHGCHRDDAVPTTSGTTTAPTPTTTPSGVATSAMTTVSSLPPRRAATSSSACCCSPSASSSSPT